MKKTLLSLIALVSIMSADQSENQGFCGALNASFPSIVKVGLDTFAIREGKTSKCEDHSQEEWKDVTANSPIYAFLISVETGLNGNIKPNLSKECVTSIYNTFVSEAISSKASTIENMKTISEKIASTPGMTAECLKDNIKNNEPAKALAKNVAKELGKTPSSNAEQKLAAYYEGLAK